MLLCCSGNQYIVNEAQNQRLVKDNSDVFDFSSQDGNVSVSQNVFDSVSMNPSAPPLYSSKGMTVSSFKEMASHDPNY